MYPIAIFLVAGLGAPDFQVRESCQEVLALYPEAAGPILWHDSPDLEVTRRLQDLRPLCAPPDYLYGVWVLQSEMGLSCCIRLDRHGQGGWWLAGGSQWGKHPITWQYRWHTILVCEHGRIEVYEVRPGKRWPAAPQPGDVPYWWKKDSHILRTRLHHIGCDSP